MNECATSPAERTSGPKRIVALGPQRNGPQVGAVLDELDSADHGPVAVITAGWEEREEELPELERVLRRDLVHVAIHARVEDCYQRDPELLAATRLRHDRLRAAHALYRERLTHTAAATQSLLAQCLAPPGAAESESYTPAVSTPAAGPTAVGVSSSSVSSSSVSSGSVAPGGVSAASTLDDPWLQGLLASECNDAVAAQQRLDLHHLTQVESIWREFESAAQPGRRPAVAHHRDEVRQLLDRCSAVCIAGGHVAILVNRLRLLDVASGLNGAHVIAWSAGAMALTERLVLFHDTPPQGPGHAEVLEPGLGLLPGVVLLPDAQRRLRLDDPVRVAQLARRFAPATCIALDQGDGLDCQFGGGAPSTQAPRGAARRLAEDGRVVRIEATVDFAASESEDSSW